MEDREKREDPPHIRWCADDAVDPAPGTGTISAVSLPESVVEETPSVDEDVWIVPSAWWRQAEPFRGRGPRRTVTVDPDAPAVVAELFALAGERFARTLDRPDSDAELVRGARLYLGTPTRLLRRARQEIHPQGAAVVGAILAAMVDHRHRAKLGAIVDDWIGRYGVGFAAEAAVLLADIRVYNPTYPRAYGSSVELIVAPAPANDIAPYHVEPVLARLREVLAAADDATYDEAVRRLAAHRSGPIARRVAATYLVRPNRGGSTTTWHSSVRPASRAMGSCPCWPRRRPRPRRSPSSTWPGRLQPRPAGRSWCTAWSPTSAPTSPRSWPASSTAPSMRPTRSG